MAQQIINIGTEYNDPDADTGRVALDKCNDNFTELYDALEEAGVIVQDVKHTAISIGAWDMDADAIKTVAYSIPASYRIVHFGAMIRNDGNTVLNDFFNAADFGGDYIGSITYSHTTGLFSLVRIDSGPFDGADFDSEAINRGFIEITLQAIS